jgi:hypothetical protein
MRAFDYVGVGLRAPHLRFCAEEDRQVGWLEIHPENYVSYFSRLQLEQIIAKDYPISLHAVGLSLGSAQGIDQSALALVKKLCNALSPFMVSDHLSWNTVDGAYLNDLIPVPYGQESLSIFERNIQQVQEALGQKILIENPSLYMSFETNQMTEVEFLSALVERTGCGLLLDLNNVYVSGHNQNFDAFDYVKSLPLDAVQEIHIAGHTRMSVGNYTYYVDSHNCLPSEEVWNLFEKTISLCGPRYSLLEWDANIPEPQVLIDQARRMELIIEKFISLPSRYDCTG